MQVDSPVSHTEAPKVIQEITWIRRDRGSEGRKWSRSTPFSRVRSVYFSAMTKGVEHDLSAEDIISETVIANANAPLAFSWLHVRQLSDVVRSAPVVRVFSEDVVGLFKAVEKVRILPETPPRK